MDWASMLFFPREKENKGGFLFSFARAEGDSNPGLSLPFLRQSFGDQEKRRGAGSLIRFTVLPALHNVNAAVTSD